LSGGRHTPHPAEGSRQIAALLTPMAAAAAMTVVPGLLSSLRKRATRWGVSRMTLLAPYGGEAALTCVAGGRERRIVSPLVRDRAVTVLGGAGPPHR
jgi:hypothetical protein